ncbi:xanthine dehydrogenase-like [Neocloeon triangulifer]|uniref:xanthine dehydrogenase-like n=1 Tax=Neocloeon triangulifer TaxID=2078957 RepID=UPI00286F12BC|nr:xanthine dehydrogenase-like [Neocloeon triangulifer]
MWNAIFGSSEEPSPTALEVTFTLNGKQVTVGNEVVEGTSLNSYIRDVAKLKGTKFMCTEGGCGACVVAATIEHPVTKQKQTLSVNSCLVPVFACHGWDIRTVEGIGNKRDGYHPVQANLAQFNGTQCGFCSPGMVMNMYSLVADGKTPTMAEVENAFGGNLCRCTGYRSILDAFKALAKDATPMMKKQCADIEDMYKICSKTGLACSGSCKKDSNFEEIVPKSVKIPAANWYKVTTLNDLFSVITSLGATVYQLSAGNTAEGVYRHYNRQFDARIDVKDVPDLRTINTSGGFTVGANVTLTEAIAAFKTQAATTGYSYLTELANHLDVVANTSVRNIGTLVGNLVLKKDHNEFPSDVFVILEAAGATLNILSNPTTTTNVTLTNFLTYNLAGKVVLNIAFPAFATNHRFRTLKITPRKQNAHAYVSAGFRIRVADTINWNVNEQPRIVFAGINPQFNRATNTENYLMGKNLLDAATIQGALNTLAAELVPDSQPLDASPQYRKQVAQGVFYKFLLGLDPNRVSASKRSGAENLIRPLSSGKQDFETNPGVYPLNEPIPKLEAAAQTAGEAEYINDIPERPGELHGAFVLTTQATGVIASIDDSAALATAGVVAFFKAADIPGKNSFTPQTLPLFVEDEEVFCSGPIKYAGQVVGLVVATSRMAATLGAGLVQVSYAKTEKPILSVREVMKSSADRTFVAKKETQKKAEQPKAAYTITGSFEIASQYHMHMETHTCIAVPTEDGLQVFSASQWIDHIQQVISEVLGITQSTVNVTVRRLGGGYGGKISRPAQVAAACALAADKLGKPVRIVMSLRTNMEAMGKRFPYIHNYDVGVDVNGKIEYLNSTCLQDNGFSFNEAPLLELQAFYPNCYQADAFNMNVQLVKTDKASNTPCRGPGTTEGVAFIEEIMEHIARVTKLDPLQVRLNNMVQLDNPLFNMINDLKLSADYDNRKANVNAFNAANRWKKRGMAIVPTQYRFPVGGNYSAIVSIHHGDGSVSIAHGGIEMGQGMNTKVAQVAAHILGLPLNKISIKPSESLTSANSMVTGGSIGSEAVSYAAMKSCQILLARLEPIRQSMGNPTWEALVQQAYVQNVDMMATFMFAPGQEISPYNIWGTAIAEVEVDILTGERQVLRVDLVEDVGQSLSPLIDVGQIEGAFVMGMGYWLTEELKYDSGSGRLLNTRTWNYKVPGAKDIPADFRINFRKNASNPLGLLNSKATGEPALNMSIVCFFALRNALDSARKDAGDVADYYDIKLPATVETIAMTSLTDTSQFTFA